MFGILALFGDAGAAIGPWLAGAVADVVSRSQGTLGTLSGSGLRAGLLVGTVFPLGVAVTTLVYGIAQSRRRAHSRTGREVRLD